MKRKSPEPTIKVKWSEINWNKIYFIHGDLVVNKIGEISNNDSIK